MTPNEDHTRLQEFLQRLTPSSRRYFTPLETSPSLPANGYFLVRIPYGELPEFHAHEALAALLIDLRRILKLHEDEVLEEQLFVFAGCRLKLGFGNDPRLQLPDGKQIRIRDPEETEILEWSEHGVLGGPKEADFERRLEEPAVESAETELVDVEPQAVSAGRWQRININ